MSTLTVVCVSCAHKFAHPTANSIEDLWGYHLTCPSCSEEMVADEQTKKMLNVDSYLRSFLRGFKSPEGTGEGVVEEDID